MDQVEYSPPLTPTDKGPSDLGKDVTPPSTVDSNMKRKAIRRKPVGRECTLPEPPAEIKPAEGLPIVKVEPPTLHQRPYHEDTPPTKIPTSQFEHVGRRLPNPNRYSVDFHMEANEQFTPLPPANGSLDLNRGLPQVPMAQRGNISPQIPPVKSIPANVPKHSYRNSIQFPANGFNYETTQFRPLNPHASASSFSRRRPLSYLENQQQAMDWRQGAPKHTKSVAPILKGAANESAVATGVPTFATRDSFDLESNKQWRYHVLKSQQDLYLTTNPDAEHINCPVAESYYVSITQGGPNSHGQLGFTMSFVDPTKNFSVITVTRLFKNNEEYYEVIVFKKPEAKSSFNEFDFGQRRPSSSSHELLNGQGMALLARQISNLPPGAQPSPVVPQVSWRSCAFLKTPSVDDINSKTTLLGKKSYARQFELHDDRGRTWIVGNRPDYHQETNSHSFDDDDDDEDMHHGKKKSSTIYFFMPGANGPESDKIMAVLQRGKSAKSLSKLNMIPDTTEEAENPNASPRRRNFFKANSSPIIGGGEEGEHDDSAAKYGILTMYESIKKRPGMWPVAAALTLAVSYGQRTDMKEKSVAEKLKRLGRKYRDGRKQVYYGHRHTQSTV